MANELTLSVEFAYAKGVVSKEVKVANLRVTVTGTKLVDQVQNIGTSEEAIDIGDVSPGGYMFARNLDSTNFISIRQATAASDLVRLDPGECALFRLDDDATAPFAIADTAACDLEFILLSD